MLADCQLIYSLETVASDVVWISNFRERGKKVNKRVKCGFVQLKVIRWIRVVKRTVQLHCGTDREWETPVQVRSVTCHCRKTENLQHFSLCCFHFFFKFKCSIIRPSSRIRLNIKVNCFSFFGTRTPTVGHKIADFGSQFPLNFIVKLQYLD